MAGSALLIDYLLTAAVSLTAGVEAIASAFPILLQHRVIVALALLTLIGIINLRGIQETGTLMDIPVYLFLFSYLPLLAYGFFGLLVDKPLVTYTFPISSTPVNWFLILHTFVTGCTALTGIESISNGVLVFKPPKLKMQDSPWLSWQL